mgnify:CR=1 FL=1
MSSQLAFDAVTILAWTATGYKLPALLRQRRDPATRSYWLALFLMALALTDLVPQPYLAIDRLVDRPNLARLLGDGLGLAAAWATQALLYHVNYPPDQARQYTRRTGWALAAALLLMTCFFALAPVDEEALDFTGRYQSAPFVAEYRLVFLFALALAIANFARLSWRYAQRTNRPALSLGLRVVAVAGAIGLGYVANEMLRIGTARLGIADPIPNPGSVSQALIATFVGVGLVGTTMPAWGPRAGIPALADWLGRYRSLRRLYPLWLALYRAHPEIALLPPRSPVADALNLRDVRFRLYRRVVEIRDGIVVLRPAMDPQIARYARQLCSLGAVAETEAEAVISAAAIAAALRAQALGSVPARASVAENPIGGTDLPSEVTALERVAHCFRRSPIVPEVLARLEANAIPSTPVGRTSR